MNQQYELYIKTHFSAAHYLAGYPGDCARLHGHNWTVEVYVRCDRLNSIGIGVDFRIIKQAVKDAISELDHANLNELPIFKDINPSSENIAMVLYKSLSKRLNADGIRVSKIKVSETEEAGVYYWES